MTFSRALSRNNLIAKLLAFVRVEAGVVPRGAMRAKKFWAVAACALALASQSAWAAPKAKAPEPQIDAVAHRIWEKLLTTCGASSFYVGSDLDGSDEASFRDHDIKIIEFRGVRYQTVPIRVSDAERLNGVSAHARITMIAHTYRVDGEPWRDGPDLIPRSASDTVNQSFRQVFENDKELGKAGAMALDLVRIHGRWAFSRGSLILSGMVSLDGNIDLEKFIAQPSSHYVCATGRATPRPPPPPRPLTAEEIAEVKEAAEVDARNRADTARRKAERAQFDADVKAMQEVSHAALVERRKILDPLEKPWRFVGTPADFHDALKVNLARRAAEYGFNAGGYEAELAAIDDVVAVCMKVTPEQWRETEKLWEDGLGRPRSPGGISTELEKEQRLHNCDSFGPPWGDPMSPARKPHPLGINRHMSKVIQGPGNWVREPLPYFEIRVVVTPTKEDGARVGRVQMDEFPYRFNVIDARIPFAGKAITPDLEAWVRGQ